MSRGNFAKGGIGLGIVGGNGQLFRQFNLRGLHMIFIVPSRQQHRSQQIMRPRQARILLNGTSEFRNCPRLKVGVPISAAEGHVKFGTIAKRLLHLSKHLNSAFFVVQVQTSNGEVVSIGKSRIQCDRRFKFSPRFLILIQFEERASQ